MKGYSSDPKIGYPLDNVISLLEIGLTQLIILLLNFEDFIAGLLIEAIDLILTPINLFECLLYLNIIIAWLNTLARTWILYFLSLLVRRSHRSTRALVTTPLLSVYFQYALTPRSSPSCGSCHEFAARKQAKLQP